MKKSELERMQDLLTGGSNESPNGFALVGALNDMVQNYENADKYDSTPPDEDWTESHEDFQYLWAEMKEFLDAISEDSVLEDDDGNTLADLPNEASKKAKQNRPENAGPNSTNDSVSNSTKYSGSNGSGSE